MDEGKRQRLGEYLQARRKERGLSTHKLAAAAGMNQATVVRIEAGGFAAPRPDKLARIAEALELSSADVFALAGYTAPSDLPALRPYLAACYPDLLTEDLDRIETYIGRIAKKRGFALAEAAPVGKTQKSEQGGERR